MLINFLLGTFDMLKEPQRNEKKAISRELLDQLIAEFPRSIAYSSRPGKQQDVLREKESIQIEQTIHSLSLLCRQLADAPHQLAPRFEAVFLPAGALARGVSRGVTRYHGVDP